MKMPFLRQMAVAAPIAASGSVALVRAQQGGPQRGRQAAAHRHCGQRVGYILPGERALGRWVARRAKMVIAISEAVHRYMTGPALGLPASQVRTIRYGIDSSPTKMCRRKKSPRCARNGA